MIMTVQSDLQKAMAACESMKGSYALMAESTEDKQAKQMFNSMKADIEKHIQFLTDRLDYINHNNQLNQKNQ